MKPISLVRSLAIIAGLGALSIGSIATANAQEVVAHDVASFEQESFDLANAVDNEDQVPAGNWAVGSAPRDIVLLENEVENRRIARREMIFQALNVIDAAQTISCLSRDVCHELNPLLGRSPSTGKVVAFKASWGGAHFLITRLMKKHAPEALGIWQVTTIGIQGGAVAWNLQFTF